MPKYLFHGSYTQQGTQGLLKEGGTSRRATIKALAKSMGGSLEVFYYAFGDDDMRTLYICASTTLYRCRVRVPGTAGF